MKVTTDPEQAGFEDAAIPTLAGSIGFTVIVIVFEVAEPPEIQLALEVITQETVLPFARELLVYVALFVPTLEPFNFH